MNKTFLPFFICTCIYANNLDMLFEGFDDETQKIQIEKQQTNLTGFYTLYGSYNYDAKQSKYKGLSSLKNSLDLSYENEYEEIKYKLSINGYYDLFYDLRNHTYEAQYEDEKKEFEIKELYVLGSLGENFDYKIGRQIITWGKSDNIVITDIINPQDRTKLALLEIKDMKLNQAMSKFDYYIDNNNLSLIAIHENRVSKTAPYGSDFNFATSHIEQNEPSNSLDETSYALALNHIGNGYDLAFYFADKYDDIGYLHNGKKEYDKFKMYGISGNLALGNFLLKSEAGYFQNVRYNNIVDNKNRFDIMGGIEYKGLKDTTLSFEYALKKIYDYEAGIALGVDGKKEYEKQSVARINKDFYNAKVHFTYMLSIFNGYEDGFHKSFVDYDYKDNIMLSFGIIDYFGKENLKFQNLEDNDRVYASIKYSF